MNEQLRALLEKHGIRTVLNAIAGYCEQKGKADELALWENGDDIDPEDLLTVADNLRKDLY